MVRRGTPSIPMPSNVKWTLFLMILAAGVELAVPAFITCLGQAREAQLGETGPQVIIGLWMVASCSALSMIVAAVRLAGGSEWIWPFVLVGLVPLACLAMIGWALAIGIVWLLRSEDVAVYLTDWENARSGRSQSPPPERPETWKGVRLS